MKRLYILLSSVLLMNVCPAQAAFNSKKRPARSESVEAMGLAVAAGTATSKSRPYVCDYLGCFADFDKKSNLTSHKVVHSDERPFACDYEGCPKNFKTGFHLNRHKLIHDEKPFVCDYEGCSKSFKKISKLNTHKRIHKGERSFACDYEGCDKAFTLKSNLTAHKMLHTGERPYACDYEGCDKAFTLKSNLTRHKKSCKARLGGAAAAGAGAPSEDPVVEEGFEDPTTLDTFLNDGEVELDESDAEMPEMDEVFKDPKDGTGD